MTEREDNSTTRTTQTGTRLELESISNFKIIERSAWEPIYIYPKDSAPMQLPSLSSSPPPSPVQLFMLGIKNKRAVLGVLVDPRYEIKPIDYKPMPDWLEALRDGVLRGAFRL